MPHLHHDRRTGSRRLWGLAIGLLVASLGFAAWNVRQGVREMGAANLARPPIEARQQELLELNIGAAGDPALNRTFADLNAQHFGGRLPPMAVVWEPRLAEVGALAAQAFTLQGMFGYIDDRKVILLHPKVRDDRQELLRALSHEMVHAFLHELGVRSADHGPAFQGELERLAAEGAFEGIVATEEERAALRAWLDSESSRLAAGDEALARETAAIAAERIAIERLRTELDARPVVPAEAEAFNARLAAYNRRALQAEAAAARGRADLEAFNRQVERHNLMVAYPDGF